jgi:hypothetical protein
VVQTVASVAGPRVGGLDLGEIEVYRGLRSELYHRGRGMAIRTDQVQGYAELAVKLLLRLLQVDLAPQLMRPPPEIAREQQDATLLERIRHAQTDIATLAAAIGCDVRRVVEALEPSFLMPSFERDLKRWLKALDQGPLGSRLQKFHTGGGRPASDPSLARAVQQGMPAPLQRFLSVHPVDPVHLAIQLERAHSSTETLLVLVDSSVGLSEGRTAASTYWVAQLLQHEDSLGDWATRDRDRVPLADPLVAFRDRAQEAVADLEGIHSALQRRMKTLDT